MFKIESGSFDMHDFVKIKGKFILKYNEMIYLDQKYNERDIFDSKILARGCINWAAILEVL